MKRAALILALTTLLAALLAACASHTPTRLVIVGGGLADDNDAVFDAFLSRAHPDRPIVILPTASGVPERSSASTRETLLAHGAHADTEVLMITVDQPTEPVEEHGLAQRLRTAGAIWFTGGDQSRIMQRFSAEPHPSPLRIALDTAVRNGAVVGGTSAGAAAMCNPMITGGRSNNAVAHGVRNDPDEPGVGIAEGLGLFTAGFVDQHFLARGRLGRLITALEHTHTDLGFGIEENSAIVTDDSGQSITVIGDPGVVFIDMREARRDGDTLTGIRVSLLCTGDTVNNGAVTPAPDATRRATHAHQTTPTEHREDDPWARQAVTRMLQALANNRNAVASTPDGTQTLRFTIDERTHIHTHQVRDTVTVVNALLELERTSQRPLHP